MSYGYLAHHGIKGQKWGIRRYQYEDGTLTPEGRRRYGYGSNYINNPAYKNYKDLYKYKTLKGQSNYYRDIRDSLREKSVSKSDLENKIKDFYKNTGNEENYSLHKAANDYQKTYEKRIQAGMIAMGLTGLTFGVGGGTLLPAISGLAVKMAFSKDEQEKLDKWVDETEKAINRLSKDKLYLINH